MIRIEEKYMRRALTLAAHGRGYSSPNPMVGAVIVHCDRIIGEGYHRRCGEAHAEVNAVNSVAPADRPLLKEATIYVTLEPCSHYGKTPPCAKLIIDTGIPKVVVGSVDPFEKVAGRGVKMLRDAGREVATGVLDKECRTLNRRFFTAHTKRRPFVTLKWAQSRDGFLDRQRTPDHPAAYRFSTPLTSLMTARLRSLNDAILTTAATVNADNPSLTVRGWDGRTPTPIILDRHNSVKPDALLLRNPATIRLHETTIEEALATLYARGITSVIVEGGPRILQRFIDERLWDTARVEVAPVTLGAAGSHPAPTLPWGPNSSERFGQNIFYHYENEGSVPCMD